MIFCLLPGSKRARPRWGAQRPWAGERACYNNNPR